VERQLTGHTAVTNRPFPGAPPPSEVRFKEARRRRRRRWILGLVIIVVAAGIRHRPGSDPGCEERRAPIGPSASDGIASLSLAEELEQP
jgi:hypothetical protein